MNPQKGKAPATTQRAFQNNNRHADFNVADPATQANADDWKAWRKTLTAIQCADIHPPVLCLVLLNLAIHANAKTKLTFPSVATLAHDCGMSLAATKRALKIAKNAGLIVAADGPRGGNRTNTVRYRIDVEVVSRGFTAEPGSPMNQVHLDALRGLTDEPPPRSPMSYEEVLKTGEEKPPGGGASFGSGFAGPKGVPPELWNEWLATRSRKPTAAQVRLLVEKGEALAVQGRNLTALVEQAMRLGLRDWPEKMGTPRVSGRALGGAKTAAEYLEGL